MASKSEKTRRVFHFSFHLQTKTKENVGGGGKAFPNEKTRKGKVPEDREPK